MIHQGNLLKQKMKELNVNAQDLADYLEMTRQNVYNIQAKSQIDFITLEKICKFLKIEESIFSNKQKSVNKSSDNSNNELIEELRTSVEKANHIIEDLKKDKDFLQNLVMQQFQLLNARLDTLGKKHSGVENVDGEKELFKVAA